MIVVDVGCQTQGPEESVRRLVGRFEPDVLFGFDPVPELVEGVDRAYGVVVRRRAAAWVHAGGVPFQMAGIVGGVQPGCSHVESVDLAAFLLALPPGEVVLKLDCEGAEYALVPHLNATGADKRLTLALVEWHPPDKAHGLYQHVRPELACPTEEW